MEQHKGWVRYTRKEKIKRPTASEMSKSMNSKRKDNTHSAQEQVDAMLTDYPDKVIEALLNGKKHFSGDFYIEVLLKSNESIIQDCLTEIFAARQTCPTPFHDQIVYKYTKADDKLEYLWVVPDKYLCELYRGYVGLVPKEDKNLYELVKKYYDGDLAKIEYFENNKKEEKLTFAATCCEVTKK